MRFAMVRRALQLASVLALAAFVLGGTGPAPADDQIKLDVLKQVKQATVRLRVTLADGTQVQGSGFFGAGPGLILTNAHVLGMLRPESRKPRKVEIVVNSGEPDEKTVLGQTLGVDSSSDLAVLAIPAKDAPPFLAVGTGDELKETDVVYVFGFPFASTVGKNITVSKTSVSSLRKNEFGRLAKIQVNGGINPGNSGGPIIGGDGKVVGVAVSGIAGTQINFAVPARLVHSFLSGRVHQRVTGAPFKDGDAVKVPITVQTIDPLNRLRKVRVETWTGNPGKAHLIAEKDRAPKPDETPRVAQDLEYKAAVARGDVLIPALPPGKVLWVEVHVIDQNGRDTWTSASPHALAPPLERKPATLGYKHQAGRRGWAVVAETTLKVRDPSGVDHNIVIKHQADIIMTLDGKANPLGEASAILTCNKPKMTLSIDGKELPLPDDETEALKQINLLRTTVRINAQGEFVSYRPDFKAIPNDKREAIAGFLIGLLKSFDSACAPLPTEEVTFGKPWKGTRELMVGSIGPTGNSGGGGDLQLHGHQDPPG